MARQEAQVQQAQRQVATQAQDSVERTARGLLEQFGAQEEPVPTKAPKSKPQAVEAGPTPEELRRLIRDEVRQAQQRAPEEEAQEPVGSVRFLVSKGVSEDIARDIEARVEARVGQTDMREASPQRTRRINVLREEIAERLLIAGPIRLQPGQTTAVALIGPNGVGKTTTLMKLAVQYAHTLKKRVAVISLDNSKVGAREQITGLAEKYQIPHQIVDSPFGLMQALREFGERDLVLLDTAGRSQYDRRALDELAEFLAVVDNLQTYLTVSAATKDIDIFGTIQQYAPIPHDGLIVTKLDETIAYGVMVNVCEKMHSALAYIAAGARIPEDLKVASGEDIARMLLVHHNSQEYRQIRAMVS
jgi:flagellar biosynthesis protein FlhF